MSAIETEIGNKVILLVEDNPGDVALMKIMLSEECDGRVVIETTSRVADAAERLKAGGIDVVLLDLALPDAHGTEALVRLQSHVSRVPIVVQTGLDDDDVAVQAMQLGAQDYITKGKSDGRLLMRRIRQAIERTRTMRDLADQRRRLDALMENIPDRVYFKNREGAFIQVNPALANLYGFDDPQQVMGKTDADFFSDEHASQARADEEGVLRTGEPVIGKMERETFPGGRTTWALTTKMALKDESGEIIGTFGVSRDITELKTAELALRGSEERYMRLLNSVTDYVYTVVLEKGHVVSTQHGAGCLAVTGFSPEEFERDTMLWHKIIFPDDRDSVVNMVLSAVKGDAAFEIEHRLVRKDGKIRWIRNKHVPRRDGSGRIVAYDGLMSDITDRKRSEEDLKAAQSQLMQAEKLHSIGQLAAGVAHEVKNPLQVILVGLQYFGDSLLTTNEEARSVLTDMREAVQRANAVVQDLLDFASPRELGMQPRQINALLEKAIRFVRHDTTKAGVKVVTNFAAGMPDASVDPTKIEQVFITLITNACHAMPAGGTLTVTTREMFWGQRPEFSQTVLSTVTAAYAAGDIASINVTTRYGWKDTAIIAPDDWINVCP